MYPAQHVQGKVPAAGCISMSRTWSASARGSHFLVSSPPRAHPALPSRGQMMSRPMGSSESHKAVFISWAAVFKVMRSNILPRCQVKYELWSWIAGLGGWALGGIDQLRSVCWVGGTKSKWLQRSGRLCRCVAWPVPRFSWKEIFNAHLGLKWHCKRSCGSTPIKQLVHTQCINHKESDINTILTILISYQIQYVYANSESAVQKTTVCYPGTPALLLCSARSSMRRLAFLARRERSQEGHNTAATAEACETQHQQWQVPPHLQGAEANHRKMVV